MLETAEALLAPFCCLVPRAPVDVVLKRRTLVVRFALRGGKRGDDGGFRFDVLLANRFVFLSTVGKLPNLASAICDQPMVSK